MGDTLKLRIALEQMDSAEVAWRALGRKRAAFHSAYEVMKMPEWERFSFWWQEVEDERRAG